MNRPTFIAIAAVTIDGKIAKHKDHMSTEWTSAEDGAFLRETLDRSDLVVVGRNTYETAKGPLSKRNCLVLTSQVDNFVKETDTLAWCNPQQANLGATIASLGYNKIAVLGGAQVYRYCLEEGLIDELYLTIEPLVFGEGISLFGDKPVEQRFRLVSSKVLNVGGTILLHYRKLTV